MPVSSAPSIDTTKVRKIHGVSKLFIKKDTQKNTPPKNGLRFQISDFSFIFATPYIIRYRLNYDLYIIIIIYKFNILYNNIIIFYLTPTTTPRYKN